MIFSTNIIAFTVSGGLGYRQLIYAFIMIFSMLIIFYILRTKKRFLSKKKYKPRMILPPPLWFYSRLLDYEIGALKPTSENLMADFMSFLEKKYGITKEMLESFTIFHLVRVNESDNDIIELYGEMYNEIESLKQKTDQEVIQYIKKIKLYFNKEKYLSPLPKRKKRDCNNC